MSEDILKRVIFSINKLNLTGYEIAEKTSLSQVGIDKILNGKSKKPRKKTINILYNLLCKKYNISKDWLKYGVGDMYDSPKLTFEDSIDNLIRRLIQKELGHRLDNILKVLNCIIEENKEIKDYIESQRIKNIVKEEKERVTQKLRSKENL